MAVATIGVIGDYDPVKTAVFLIIAAAKSFDAISDVFYGLFQQRERMDFVSRALIGNGLLSVILVAGAFALTGSIVGIVIGYAIGSLVPLLAYTMPVAMRRMRSEPQADALISSDVRAVMGLARAALPLGIVMLLLSLNTSIPRIFIERSLGENALGIFAAIAYLMVFGGILTSALGQAASPRLAQHFAQRQRREFSILLLKFIGLAASSGLLAFVGASIAGDDLLRILYDDEYANHSKLLLLLVVAAT